MFRVKISDLPESRDLRGHPEWGKLINPPGCSPHCKASFSTWVNGQSEPAGSVSSLRVTINKKLGSKMREEKPSSVFLIQLSVDAA